VCIIGSKALTASETVENEPLTAVAEWMSEVFKHSTSVSFTACFTLDLKLGEGAKRINVELIYQYTNNTIDSALLFDYDVGNADLSVKERFVTFEFLLRNVAKYQVCYFWLHSVASHRLVQLNDELLTLCHFLHIQCCVFLDIVVYINIVNDIERIVICPTLWSVGLYAVRSIGLQTKQTRGRTKSGDNLGVSPAGPAQTLRSYPNFARGMHSRTRFLYLNFRTIGQQIYQLWSRNLPFPIDKAHRLYNSLLLQHKAIIRQLLYFISTGQF